MILNQISILDCFVFVIFLAPQLLIDVGLRATVLCAAQALPFLLFHMPKQLINERYMTAYAERPPFVQRATLFQDLVIRCVRYAFAHIPASIGAVFFSRKVALPFMRFRMLRHGYLRSPISYTTITAYTDDNRKPSSKGSRRRRTRKGIWIIPDRSTPPDIVVYYCHGGGFSMGSATFYLEFLFAWITLLRARQGFRNPAIFALDYTLVPTACFPTQVREVRAGYEFVLRQVKDWDPARVCLAGDSAGATLLLSLLLSLAHERHPTQSRPPADAQPGAAAARRGERAAGFVTLISPWCRLVSDLNRDTPSDYLNAESLHLYARQYMGGGGGPARAAAKSVSSPAQASDPLHYANGAAPSPDLDPDSRAQAAAVDPSFVSPGDCADQALWAAMPTRGFHFVYGAEEVFAPETEALVAKLKRAGCQVDVTREPASIHAWPVVNLFLGNTRRERLKGLDTIVDVMGRNIVL